MGFNLSLDRFPHEFENVSNYQNTLALELKPNFSGLLCFCPILSVLVLHRAGGGFWVRVLFLFLFKRFGLGVFPQSVGRAVESVNPKWRSAAAALLWWWWEA